MSEVVDTTAEEIGTDLESAATSQPTTLFRTDDPAEVVVRATAVADALKSVLKSRNMIQGIQGKEYVKVEGWQTLGSMVGVVPVVTWTRQLEDGWEARVEARTLDGRVVGAAEAMCTTREKMWSKRDPYALRSMAQTRATSKALRGPLGFVVTLAGYEATPAEEMPASDAPAPAAGWSSAGITAEQYRAIESRYVELGQPLARMVALLDKLDVPAHRDLGARLRLVDAPTALKVLKALAGAEMPAADVMPVPEDLS